MITEKEIKKQITFFYYEKIDQATLDDLMKFIHSVPQVANPRYNNGTNILLDNIKNVYFIVGGSCAGKTTAAEQLCRKYEMFHYNTDNMRSKHFRSADSKYQPALCRKIGDYSVLDPEEAWQ